jgi:hypothetical protein
VTLNVTRREVSANLRKRSNKIHWQLLRRNADVTKIGDGLEHRQMERIN